MSTSQIPISYQARLTAALVRHKHEPMPPIRMALGVSELLDPAFCGSVHDELHGTGECWEVRKATPNLWEHLPQTSGVYMFVLAPELKLKRANPERAEEMRYTLYVGKAGSRGGQTSTFRSRYKADYGPYLHKDPELLWGAVPEPMRREVLFRKYLNLYPLEYWYLEIKDISTIDRMEWSLIKLLSPPLNIQGRVKLRTDKTAPAFKGETIGK